MKRYLFVANERKRRAISEIMGTIVMVAVTLIAGAAVFSFVNGQAATSESQYGASVANNVNYLKEHFVILGVQLSGCSSTDEDCNGATITVYNNGAVDLTVKQIKLINSTVWTTGSNSTTRVAVPQLYVVVNQTATYAFDESGSTVLCKSASHLPETTVRQEANPASYIVNLPGCVAGDILIGGGYQIQVLGLYGNIATYSLTASD